MATLKVTLTTYRSLERYEFDPVRPSRRLFVDFDNCLQEFSNRVYCESGGETLLELRSFK